MYPPLDGLDVDQQIEVLAFMQAKGFTPAGRGAGGRFQRRPGGRGQPQLANGPARVMPPRGRADMTCVNCNRKGRSASECRQPKREKHERLCFTCNKAGHEARNCPDKPAMGARPPIKAIEDAGPARRVAVMAIANKPCAQQPHLGDFIRSAATTPTRNRFQPLTLGMWQDIAAEVKSTTVSAP